MSFEWLIPSYIPDVWLQRVKNNLDYFALGFISLLFIAIYFGFLSSLAAGSQFANFGIIGFFLWVFGFVIASATLLQEQLSGITKRFGLVIYGRSTTLKALGVDFMLGGLIGMIFALPSLFPLSIAQTLAISSFSTTPIEAVFIATLVFAVLEEFWRASTFEPFIASFLQGGSEIPILLVFLGVISFFVPSFLSAPFIGIFLILFAVIYAIVATFTPIGRILSYYQFTRHAMVILIGVTSWVLFHVLTATTYQNPYALYASAFAFGFIVDSLNAIRQSAIPSYTAHITNNSVTTVSQLRITNPSYNYYISAFVIFIFAALFTFPVLLNKKR